MATIKASIAFDETIAAYRVHSPYNQDWINDLKFKVPGAARSWDKPNKVWIIDPYFIDVIKELSDKYLGGYTETKTAPAPVAKVPFEEAAITLVKLAPKEALMKLYKLAALELHPDRGGDKEAMTKLNIAWSTIKVELGI